MRGVPRRARTAPSALRFPGNRIACLAFATKTWGGRGVGAAGQEEAPFFVAPRLGPTRRCVKSRAAPRSEARARVFRPNAPRGAPRVEAGNGRGVENLATMNLPMTLTSIAPRPSETMRSRFRTTSRLFAHKTVRFPQSLGRSFRAGTFGRRAFQAPTSPGCAFCEDEKGEVRGELNTAKRNGRWGRNSSCARHGSRPYVPRFVRGVVLRFREEVLGDGNRFRGVLRPGQRPVVVTGSGNGVHRVCCLGNASLAMPPNVRR